MNVPAFWFLGLPGSGKSTLAAALFRHLSGSAPEGGVRGWELLDGDVIREFLGPELGYAVPDRRKSVRIVGLLASHLNRNGIGVVIANISPFRDLRRFMREHLPGYAEIHCSCPVAACIERDPKGHYRRQLEQGAKDFVGLDIPFEEPEAADLVIETAKLPVAEAIETACRFADRRLGRAA